MSEKLTWDTLPALAEGHSRHWCECKKCGAVGFYDTAPDAGYVHNVIPCRCKHHAVAQFGSDVLRLTEREARARTDFPIAMKEEEPHEYPCEWWGTDIGARTGLLYD